MNCAVCQIYQVYLSLIHTDFSKQEVSSKDGPFEVDAACNFSVFN